LFGTFTAFVAKLFLEPTEKIESDRIRSLEIQVENLSTELRKFIADARTNDIEREEMI
jgi:hypothetical protein